MKSQANQFLESQKCSKCNKEEDHLIDLSCHHSFCIECLTYWYLKFKTAMHPRVNTFKCVVCDRTTELDEDDMQAINEFTNQLVEIMMQQENKKGSGKGKGDNLYQLSNNEMSSGNKQFKSHDLSTEKVTPAGKGFYSRCESPKSGFNQVFCQVHPEQELSIICFSCDNALLCISCIANKKHSSHHIKTIVKGLETIHEQITLARLRGKEYLDRLDISKRRLDDRRIIIQQRRDKTINTLRLHFNNLLELVNRKCEEVITGYSAFFQRNMEEAVRDRARVDEEIKCIKKELQRLTDISKINTNPIDLIRKSTRLIEEMNELRQPQTLGGDINQCDSDRVVREVVHLCQKLERIQPYSRKESLKTHGVDNCKSQEKLLKENYFKRVKTNIMSLNSSRDKKEKKCTKTQQDEKRNKSKANYKTESSSKPLIVNKDFPSYVLHHLDKQSKDSPMQFDMNPLQSSFKSTSKVLSKSHIPSAAEQHRRRKEHTALVKDVLQRKQRKTCNGTSKQMRGATEGMRKKKIPY